MRSSAAKWRRPRTSRSRSGAFSSPSSASSGCGKCACGRTRRSTSTTAAKRHDRDHARVSLQRRTPAREPSPESRGQPRPLRPLRAAARPQLLRRGHDAGRPGSGDRHGGRSGPRGSDREHGTPPARRSPHAGDRTRAGGRHLDGRRARARVLGRAGARARARGAAPRARRGDREEPLRVSGGGRVIEKLVAQMLKELGEDPHREGLERTPERVAKSMQYLTSGYAKNVDEILNDALFVEEYDEMVVVKDIDFFSMCEHHLLPFIGKAHIAYMPHKKIVGLSKIPRLVEMFSRRLNISTRRGIFESPTIFLCGMYAMCALPMNGRRWCSHIEKKSMSFTTTISSYSSTKSASLRISSTFLA